MLLISCKETSETEAPRQLRQDGKICFEKNWLGLGEEHQREPVNPNLGSMRRQH
jgi:hypothetical protein